MTAFRLARLLALRENQERAEQIRWAQAQRAVVEASELREAGRARIRSAYANIASSHEQLEGAHGDPRSGHAFKATLAAYETLDALHERGRKDDESLAETRSAAQEARVPYDEKRQEVEALRRLEMRFKREKRRKKRRRENREREEFINGRYRGSSSPAPQASSPGAIQGRAQVPDLANDPPTRDSKELNR